MTDDPWSMQAIHFPSVLRLIQLESCAAQYGLMLTSLAGIRNSLSAASSPDALRQTTAFYQQAIAHYFSRFRNLEESLVEG